MNIKKMAEKEDFKGLVKALKVKDKAVQQTARNALRSFKNPANVPDLINMLSNSDPDARWAAITALGAIKDSAADPAIVNYMNRMSAVANVTRSAGKVSDLVTQEFEMERAIMALGEIKDPKSIPALAIVFNSSDQIRRKAVVLALEKIENVEAAPTLISALGDSNYEVRNLATRALEAIKDRLPYDLTKILQESYHGTPLVEAELKILVALEKQMEGTIIPTLTQFKPDSFGFMTRDRHVILLALHGKRGSRELESIPEEIGDLSALQKLSLSDNHLRSLPESIGNLTALNELYIDNNSLASLPDSIGNLVSLKTLIMYNNRVTSLPESFGNLISLETLDLGVNHPISLPESFGKLTSLKNFLSPKTPAEPAAKPIAKSAAKQVRRPVPRHLTPDQSIAELLKTVPERLTPPYDDIVNEVKEIGELLNQEGGYELMQYVCQGVYRASSYKGRTVESMWDGIGDWRG